LELSPETYINLMDQYCPAGRVSREKFAEINRRITAQEYEEALGAARREGLRRLDRRLVEPAGA
jgi:putative pyruvate formate lyase activating enzyme